jgi:hypothetical protein
MQGMPILRLFILDLIGFILYPLGSAKIGVDIRSLKTRHDGPWGSLF